MSPAAFQLAREHGYEAVCSAFGDYNHPGGDAFHVRRIHPDNLTVLRNWATFDPRKLCFPVPYEYRCEEQDAQASNKLRDKQQPENEVGLERVVV
jgi:hypothetical protein